MSSQISASPSPRPHYEARSKSNPGYAEWKTNRSFGEAFRKVLPSEDTLSSQEAKLARSLLEILPDQVKALSYQDFRLLMGMAAEVVGQYSNYQKKATAYIKACQDALSKVSEVERPEVEKKIQESLRNLERERPRSLEERLQEQSEVLKGGVDVWRHGVNILSPEALPVVETLRKLLVLDTQMQPPMLAQPEARVGPAADENFAHQMLRLLRVCFPGGVNIRHPEQTDPRHGVFRDFESLKIGICDFHAGVILTPCSAGYRYEVRGAEDAQSERGVILPGQTLLLGRPGGISFSVAGVNAKLPRDDISPEIAISAPHVSRAAIEIAALPAGGVVVVDRGSQSTVVFEAIEHGKYRTMISGVFTSVAGDGGFLGKSQESKREI